MSLRRHSVATCATILLLTASMTLVAGEARVVIDTPMSPPVWALLERELLDANTKACRAFYEKYFDDRGWLLCVERWGGDDGPDDAIENCNDWPILHALGAGDDVLAIYKKAWEGHLRQYTLAKTMQVPLARDGMYYKEFPVMFDWLHNGEGLTVFNLQGLSDPHDAKFQARVKRFAGFYMNEDPGAPNYDAEHRIIRSLFNGSRGPLLRKATGLDWAGDPIEVEHRFDLGHGETSYDQMVAHFKDYNDVVGDNPLNLLATSLALNAFMLTGEEKYRNWVLEYVDAWHQRMSANGNIIPTNVGLDGKLGSAAGGKWYGGVYGWGFSVVVPQDGTLAHRNHHDMGFGGFMNAYVLNPDDRWLDIWRKQTDVINAAGKVVDGQSTFPTMYGDKGWYAFVPGRYSLNAMEIYYLSMRPEDRKHVPDNPWLSWLEGNNAEFPETALRNDFEAIRHRSEARRKDTSTPDTRLADDPMEKNPASITSLIQLMLGGLHPGHRGGILNCRLRYFDPITRRAGVPEGVAALVEELTSEGAVVTVVNTNQLEPRTVVVQAGGYAEHQFVAAKIDDRVVSIDDSKLTVELAPGAGRRLFLKMKRYANRPTMSPPWER